MSYRLTMSHHGNRHASGRCKDTKDRFSPTKTHISAHVGHRTTHINCSTQDTTFSVTHRITDQDSIFSVAFTKNNREFLFDIPFLFWHSICSQPLYKYLPGKGKPYEAFGRDKDPGFHTVHGWPHGHHASE